MRGRKKHRRIASGRGRADSTDGGGLYGDLYPTVTSWLAARVASEQDADDLAQQVFAELAHRQVPDDPKAYIIGIAANVLSRYRRRKARERMALRKLVGEAISGPGAQPGELSDAEGFRTRDSEAMQNLLAELTRDQIKLLKLRFVKNLPVAEVARRVGCSKEAAYKRIQRIVQRLRQRGGMEPNGRKKSQ